MALRTIRTEGDPILRKICRPVTQVDDRTKELIGDMLDTMYDADGVGLAAPQVGILKRIVVIDVGDGPVVMVNPEILETSGSQTGQEGCLSIPGKAGIVTRPMYVKAKAYDENMNELQKDTNTRTVSSDKYVLPVGAKVYVKVTCYGVGNQYKIRSNYYATEGWEKESNDIMALATDLTAGKTLHGSINSKKDVDYYRYVATGSGYFNFKFTNADGGNNQYWKLSVYDEKKKLLQTVETEDDLQISTAKLGFRKGKEIYLKVERNINDYACGHEYTVTVNQYKADNWEQEYNDSFATATTVKKNKTCSANNYAVKDKDYFVYKAAKKGKVTIQVSLPDSGYWNVCVYNQKKKLVKQEDYAQTGQKFTVKAAKGQKLYVMVKARTKSAVGKTYRVTVKQK